MYIRFAGADDCEFAGSVIATESTRCMLAVPKQFFSCCGVVTSDAATSLQVLHPHPPSQAPLQYSRGGMVRSAICRLAVRSNFDQTFPPSHQGATKDIFYMRKFAATDYPP